MPGPAQILVMRHAEKPDDASDPHLAPAGVARAQRLAAYIPDTFGKPDAIFAAAISKHSERPFETVELLAAACGLKKPKTPFADAQYALLANQLLTAPYAGQRIVVCWHHGEIPDLMKALGAKHGDYPRPWDDLVFNLILKTDFAGGTVTVTRVVEPF
jgi:phosphohistidine phosphatase SixA